MCDNSTMSIGVMARKLLWGRSGNCCAWPGCNQRLTVGMGDDEVGVLVTQGLVLGEEAHIRSSRVNGPRYDASYPKEDLDTYDNLVLLCPTHHAAIDKNGGAGWPISEVLAMRSKHESRVDGGREVEARRRQMTEERLVAQLSVWERKLGVDAPDEWDSLIFGLNLPIPRIGTDRADRLVVLGRWLLERNWPSGFPKMRAAFSRNLGVVQNLVSALDELMVQKGGRFLELARPYKELSRWDPAEYERLLRETNICTTMVHYLAIELARSANLVITAAREELDPLYRLDEGVLLTRVGDGIVVNLLRRDEYKEWDWSSPPSPPSLAQIRSAIIAAAEPEDARIEYVDPQALFTV
jgi:hypothetical protein